MWLEKLKVIAVLAGLVGFIAMLISVACAYRSAKKGLARGVIEPNQTASACVKTGTVVTDATLNFSRAAQLQNRER